MDSHNGMPLEEIINEFISLNPKIVIDATELKKTIDDIFNEYKSLAKAKELVISDLELIKSGIISFSQVPIFQPDLSFLNASENDEDFLFIAKMIFHHKEIFGFIPRKIQIISLLYFIKKEKREGMIQQINTGEGKSLIIVFLAVYIAKKRKKKIDILTSSQVLAKRDAKYFKEFYNKFGLTVNFASPDDNYKCYESDIVYGDTLCFEGDFLRTSFMGVPGRGFERKFECIIIDEIDNIAIDNLKNTTELLDNFHGYKFLEYPYLFIYKTLTEITKKEEENNILEQKESIIKNLYDLSKKEFSDIKRLRKEKNIFIPNHLKEYIIDRLNDWCESAFIAKFIFNNNENYIIKEDPKYKIKTIYPIDFYNTGVTQENSVWAGLHQFLQIKEGIMLTEENLSSCYISNLSYFNKYITKDNNSDVIENNIYGLTGTVGSEYNIKTLDVLYKLKVLFIPPFKKSILEIEKPIIITQNEKNDDNRKKRDVDSEWREAIISKTLQLIKSGRSVLIVYQYISEAERIYELMKDLKNSKISNIINYSRSDKEEQNKFLEEEIKPRTVIISTNISGRGTDIRISKLLNKNKGLHVILTYEPFNERIEKQAFGRAARKGENGSAGKIIICPFKVEDIIKKREEREKKESDFLINVYKFKIEAFENIFCKFSKYLENIYSKYNIIKSRNDDEDPLNKDQRILLLDIKERWGLFLINNNLNKKEKEYRKSHDNIEPDVFKNIEKNYEIFEKELNQYDFDLFLSERKKNDNTTNLIDYKFQNALYLNKSLNETRIETAIETDSDFCLGSYMFRLINYFKKLIKFLKENEPNKLINDFKLEELCKEIKLNFQKINALLKDFDKHYNNIKELSSKLCDRSSDFVKQFNTKYDILIFINFYLNNLILFFK